MTKQYDYLVVGAGLFGATFANEAKHRGNKVVVVEKRPHIGGNLYTEEHDGICVHCYGPHIFHTDDKAVWEYMQSFAKFRSYLHCPEAEYHGKLFSLPFTLKTFRELCGVNTAEEMQAYIENERKASGIISPKNLEEQALYLVGRKVYETLIRGYTEKQWGRECCMLSPDILKRIPIRYTDTPGYFDDRYQGIPENGYTSLIARMLEGVEVRLCTDYLQKRETLCKLAEKVIFTGPIDAYFNYRLGELKYRTVRFEETRLEQCWLQRTAVVNNTEKETPYIRTVEYKHFMQESELNEKKLPHTVIAREYSMEWKREAEPFYPVNDKKNNDLYPAYRKLAESEENVFFGGRLGEYRYYDMDDTVASALSLAKNCCIVNDQKVFT